jgi:hypothetical protein
MSLLLAIAATAASFKRLCSLKEVGVVPNVARTLLPDERVIVSGVAVNLSGCRGRQVPLHVLQSVDIGGPDLERRGPASLLVSSA